VSLHLDILFRFSASQVFSTEKSGEFVNFRAILLTRCQLEFEKDKDAEDKIEKLRAAMKEETDVSSFSSKEILHRTYKCYIHLICSSSVCDNH
jgi:hypothetical protein